MNIHELKKAKELFELVEKMQSYIQRMNRSKDIPSYSLGEEGIFVLVGGIAEEDKDIVTTRFRKSEQDYDGMAPIKWFYPKNEKRKETYIFYKGRFIDALASALQEPYFYSNACGPSPDIDEQGYLVKISLTEVKRRDDLEKILNEGGNENENHLLERRHAK